MQKISSKMEESDASFVPLRVSMNVDGCIMCVACFILLRKMPNVQ